VRVSSGENSVTAVPYFTDVLNIKVNCFKLVHETYFFSISVKVSDDMNTMDNVACG
jgi:hypothetical protein